MSLTFTAPERTTVLGNPKCYARLEIQDPDLVWTDVSTALDTPDWFNAASIADQIDRNTVEFSASLLRDTGSLSLAPLREDSTINRDAAVVYAPMLDLVRMWRVSVAVVDAGGTPSGSDWKEIGKGYIDTIDVNDIEATVDATGRGEEAAILDTEILELRTYSVGSTATMAQVIQAMLNDNMASPPTLYEPVAITFVINEYQQDYGNLMTSIAAVASLVGAVIRYRYDAAGVNRLTLFIPDRTAVAGGEVWTIAATEYLRLPLNRFDIAGVRNSVSVRYMDSGTSTVKVVFSPSSGTSASITRYGLRSLPIDLSEDSQIFTATQAQALADAIRSDLEFPYLQQQFITYGFWFVQLCDYGKTTANSVHYNNDQYGGVVGYAHDISGGTITTSVNMGAIPAAGYKKWLQTARNRRLRPPGGVIGDPMLPDFTPPSTDGIDIKAGQYLTITITSASCSGNPETLTVDGPISGQIFSGTSATLPGQAKTFGPALSGGRLTFLAWHQTYGSGPLGLISWTNAAGPFDVGLDDGLGDFDYNDIIFSAVIGDTATYTPSSLTATPTNNAFAWRKRLFGTSDYFQIDNTGFDMEASEPTVSGTLEGSMWFVWKAPTPAYDVVIHTLGTPDTSLDTVIAVYTSTGYTFASAFTLVASNDNSAVGSTLSWLTFTTAAAIRQTYYIQVGSKATAARGEIRTSIIYNPVYAAPANDNFANRQVITGSTGTVSGTMNGAGFESGEPNVFNTYASVWYEWTAPASGTVTFTAAGAGYAYMDVASHTGTTLAALVQVAESYSPLAFAAVNGTVYKIQVVIDGGSGTFNLGWNLV